MIPLPKSSPLTGADWFMLAMDPHMTRFKTVGNICRYALYLEGCLTADQIRTRIEEKKVFSWLSRLRIRHLVPFRRPVWVAGEENSMIEINTWKSMEDQIPEHIFQRDIEINKGPLFYFDLISIPENKSIFVFSWHHILMDGRGAGLLLKYLNSEFDVSDHSSLIPFPGKGKSFRKNISNMYETKDFIKASSRKPLASIFKGQIESKPDLKYRIIRFDLAETAMIHDHALKHGARFGKSPFYLATATRATHAVLKKRGNADQPYWIPVPQDDRLRGSFGPMISNQLSFIFYRIPVQSLTTIKACVTEITAQMVDQIKLRVPKNYSQMMDWFRRLPLKPYYQLIKGPTGGSIASFLFSVAADSPTELKLFFDRRVEDAINFPPNTVPPGLTIVFMRFNGALKIIISYVEQAISTEEINFFEKMIRKDLLKGDLPE